MLRKEAKSVQHMVMKDKVCVEFFVLFSRFSAGRPRRGLDGPVAKTGVHNRIGFSSAGGTILLGRRICCLLSSVVRRERVILSRDCARCTDVDHHDIGPADAACVSCTKDEQMIGVIRLCDVQHRTERASVPGRVNCWDADAKNEACVATTWTL